MPGDDRRRRARLRPPRRRVTAGQTRPARGGETSGPEGGSRTLRVVTVIATVAAALAAVGGLWAQAVTTYWSQQTAKDQLAQSREDSDRDERAQAGRVTLWIAKTKSGPRPHIANRSPDAVTNVVLEHPSGVGLILPDLPPCTQVVYMPKPYRGPDGKMHAPPAVLTEWTLFNSRAGTPSPALFFTDSRGVSWERRVTALKRRPSGDHGVVERLPVPPGELPAKSAEMCDAE